MWLDFKPPGDRGILVDMALSTAAEPVPFVIDEHGVARVGGTRLTLATVLESYLSGSAPDEIIAEFPYVAPSEIFAVVAYYLRHKPEADAYLATHRRLSDEVERKIERDFPPDRIRARVAQARASRDDATPPR